MRAQDPLPRRVSNRATKHVADYRPGRSHHWCLDRLRRLGRAQRLYRLSSRASRLGGAIVAAQGLALELSGEKLANVCGQLGYVLCCRVVGLQSVRSGVPWKQERQGRLENQPVPRIALMGVLDAEAKAHHIVHQSCEHLLLLCVHNVAGCVAERNARFWLAFRHATTPAAGCVRAAWRADPLRPSGIVAGPWHRRRSMSAVHPEPRTRRTASSRIGPVSTGHASGPGGWKATRQPRRCEKDWGPGSRPSGSSHAGLPARRGVVGGCRMRCDARLVRAAHLSHTHFVRRDGNEGYAECRCGRAGSTVDDSPNVGAMQGVEERHLSRVVEIGAFRAGSRPAPQRRLPCLRAGRRARTRQDEDLLPEIERALGVILVADRHACADIAVGHLGELIERVVVHLQPLLVADRLQAEDERGVAPRFELHHLGHVAQRAERGRIQVIADADNRAVQAVPSLQL
eukprot:scaffold633_cov134-Isochrysis_galbana.AAC.6